MFLQIKIWPLSRDFEDSIALILLRTPQIALRVPFVMSLRRRRRRRRDPSQKQRDRQIGLLVAFLRDDRELFISYYAAMQLPLRDYALRFFRELLPFFFFSLLFFLLDRF